MHVIPRDTITLIDAALGHLAAGTTHQEGHGALVQLLDAAAADVLRAGAVPEIEDEGAGVEEGLEFGFGRLARDDRGEGWKLLGEDVGEGGLRGRQVGGRVENVAAK